MFVCVCHCMLKVNLVSKGLNFFPSVKEFKVDFTFSDLALLLFLLSILVFSH